MSKQPHLWIRLIALTNALLLVFGLIASRTGWLPTEGFASLVFPGQQQDQNSTELSMSHSVPQIGHEVQKQLDSPGSTEMIQCEVEANKKSANNDSSVVQPPLFRVGTDKLLVPELDPEPVIILEARRHAAEVAEAKLAQLEYEYDKSLREAKIVSTKSIVLIEAKYAKLKAKGAFKSFSDRTRESFDSRDLNHDNKLTKDELDDRVWDRCLEHRVVVNDAVPFEGFAKMFEWYSNDTSLEPQKIETRN